MTRGRSHRPLLIAVLACLVGAALPGQSSAATLSPTAGFKMSSVAILGDDVYWFQRVSSYRYGSPGRGEFLTPPPPDDSQSIAADPPGVYVPTPSFESGPPGRVLHRKLNSSKVSVVYKPGDGMSITGFVARAGRVVVATANETDKPRSAIVELTPNGDGWSEKQLFDRVGGQVDGRCDSRLNLLNVDSAARIVFEDSVTEGRDGKCELRRRKTILKRAAIDGVVEELGTSISGWGLDPESLAGSSMRAGPGDWYVRSGAIADFELFNIQTRAEHASPLMLSSPGRLEVSADGRVLRRAFTKRKTRFYMLNRTAENTRDNVVLNRGGHVTWFHLCGPKVLEIARSRNPRKRGGGRFWYLYVRSHDGTVERKLPTKLRRGTTFNGCSADNALFSRSVRKGRVLQTSVALGG